MNEQLIMIFSYKPDCIDTCMGCEMNRFSSDVDINIGTMEELISILVQLDLRREPSDANWCHAFVIDGFLFQNDIDVSYRNDGNRSYRYPNRKKRAEELYEEFNYRFNEEVKKEVERRKLRKEKLKLEEEEKKAAFKKKQEITLLRELQEKYKDKIED